MTSGKRKINKVIDKGFRSYRFVSTIVKHPVFHKVWFAAGLDCWLLSAGKLLDVCVLLQLLLWLIQPDPCDMLCISLQQPKPYLLLFSLLRLDTGSLGMNESLRLFLEWFPAGQSRYILGYNPCQSLTTAF